MPNHIAAGFFLATLLLGSAGVPPAHAAEYVTTEKVACLTSEAFDQWTAAKAQQDRRGMEHLAKTSCIVLRAGQPASLLSSSWGKARIRVYAGDKSMELWTYSEAVEQR